MPQDAAHSNPCGPDMRVLGHSLYRSSLVQDPGVRTRRKPSRRHPVPRREPNSVRRDAPAAGVTDGKPEVLDGPAVLRKEVIQPQVPLRLPCYDFTPVADLTVAGCLLAVSAPSSGKANSHGVTGGVYKARERIHRGVLIRDY
jgi:hypothetical protein